MVIRSKLIPPKLHQEPFRRPRLSARLAESSKYPLTLVNAGTGFGKTTALVELGELYRRVYWYHITEPDRDPALFLAHLAAALWPEASLEQNEYPSGAALLTGVINHLTAGLEEEAVLVLDDYHLVRDVPEINRWLEQLVEQRPPLLRIAAACRQIPDSPGFIRWRVKGTVLVINQADLSFSADEIQSLFCNHYGYAISPQQAGVLYSYSDGWIIALQMIWQRLRSSRSKNLDHILANLPSALEDVFTFLAQEVLMRQPEAIQQFLLATSVLRQMEAPACDALLGRQDSQEMLEQLNANGLFIFTVDHTSFHYQRLFQDFLLARAAANRGRARDLHQRAAEYYMQIRDYEEAIHHLLAAGDQARAAELVAGAGQAALDSGRLGTLTGWVERIDTPQRDAHPELYLLLGDALRLGSQFDEAIGAYASAEKAYLEQKNQPGRSRALRSQAKVYLDTIRPLKASSLLMEAMSLLEPQEYPREMADMLDLLAENKLNLGKPEEARALHQEAVLLRADTPNDDIYLESRAFLRTGRLREAIGLIDSSGALADDSNRPQRFHREMSLLLALIHLMLGDYTAGEFYSREGIRTGRQLDSPFVEAVGWMRLGHAFQRDMLRPWLKDRLQQAGEYYERSIGLVKPFKVVRVQVEPLWGLCRLYGYTGRLAEAQGHALTAIDIAGTSGDYWFVALINTTLGISCTLAKEYDQAVNRLDQAVEGFREVGDIFGESTARSARVLNQWLSGRRKEALEQFAGLAGQMRALDQSFVLVKTTHLGFPDPLIFLPVLLDARREGIESAWIDALLQGRGLDGADYHPGYGLYAACLGGCDVWRGADLLTARDWQREKARQLFQFLAAGRGKWFSRDQIADRLWPDLDADGAAQNFKVALNALNHALEPTRESGRSPFFISRRDGLYGLNPSAEIVLDTDDFASMASSASEEDLLAALEIYRGDFLAGCGEESWFKDTRERMRELYLQTAMRQMDCWCGEGRWDDALRLAHRVLGLDACFEPAYQVLMRCHAARGSRSTVHSVYLRCKTALKEELDVEPSPETTRLLETLLAG